MTEPSSHTAFCGEKFLCSGPLHQLALAIKAHQADAPLEPVLIFDDETGRPIDLDLRGSDEDIASRYSPPERPRGRPKLGVIGREVTLLPRHWDWLNAQQGGASVALRKLIDEARKQKSEQDNKRQRRDAAYAFMSVMAGNRPHFEDASRALFADEGTRFRALIREWPADIRQHIEKLAES